MIDSDQSKSTENYEVLYKDISSKFWDLKNQDRTKEEKKYNELLTEFHEMINEQNSKASVIDAQIHDIKPGITDYDEIEAKYKDLLRIYKNLKELRDGLIKL